MASAQQPDTIAQAVASGSVPIPFAWRVVSGFGSAASMVLLAALGVLYENVSSEWQELKTSVHTMQQQLAAMPTAQQLEKVETRVQSLSDRVLVIETRCCLPAQDSSSPP